MARAPRPAAPALLPALVLLTQHPRSNRHCARRAQQAGPRAASRKDQSGTACSIGAAANRSKQASRGVCGNPRIEDIAASYSEREHESPLNFGATIAHLESRRLAMGGRLLKSRLSGEWVTEPLTSEQIGGLKERLSKGLEQGAVGIGMHTHPVRRLRSSRRFLMCRRDTMPPAMSICARTIRTSAI